VIIQSDQFKMTDSVTICAFTTDPTGAPTIRLVVEPNGDNGLTVRSQLMVDKILTVPRTRLGRRLGTLDRSDMDRLEGALLAFLGLAG
jgi:mRNA interferase MazF